MRCRVTVNGKQRTLTAVCSYEQHSDRISLSLLLRPLDFHPRILYLTGTQEQLAKVTKGYRVYFSKVRERPLQR